MHSLGRELPRTTFHFKRPCYRSPVGVEDIVSLLREEALVILMKNSRPQPPKTRRPAAKKRPARKKRAAMATVSAPAELDEIEMRFWLAYDQISQANAIYSLVLLVFRVFPGFLGDDAKWGHRLDRMAYLSGLVPFSDPTGEDERPYVRAMATTALYKVPQFLCAFLVSAFEALLEDVTSIAMKRYDPSKAEETIRREVQNAMRGRVLDYIPRLASLAQHPKMAELDWGDFAELVAVRNVIVHRQDMRADSRYLGQAGESRRAALGEQLTFDDGRFMHGFATTMSLIADLRDKVFCPNRQRS